MKKFIGYVLGHPWESLLTVVLSITVFMILSSEYKKTHSDWYIGCAQFGGQEFIMKVQERPTINSHGIIFIGNEAFVTPMDGMSCKIIPADEVDELNPKVTPTSNPVI